MNKGVLYFWQTKKLQPTQGYYWLWFQKTEIRQWVASMKEPTLHSSRFNHIYRQSCRDSDAKDVAWGRIGVAYLICIYGYIAEWSNVICCKLRDIWMIRMMITIYQDGPRLITDNFYQTSRNCYYQNELVWYCTCSLIDIFDIVQKNIKFSSESSFPGEKAWGSLKQSRRLNSHGSDRLAIRRNLLFHQTKCIRNSV